MKKTNKLHCLISVGFYLIKEKKKQMTIFFRCLFLMQHIENNLKHFVYFQILVVILICTFLQIVILTII